MAEPAPRVATYDDVMNAPEHMVAEIIAGELFLSPRPATAHGQVADYLGDDLRGPFDRRGGPDGWWIRAEPELHLGRPDPRSAVAVPDLAGWRRSRMPRMPDAPAIELPPDWLCEILSPSPRATRRDRILKPDLYASRSVPYMWLIDPIAHTLEVYRLDGRVYGRIQAFAGHVVVRAEPFDAVELDMGGWWLPGDEPSEP